ncbi:hypothetical protein TWF718_010444 [Orbilia javanica]|uniref:Uncharacterized protein n=1 Tax=Orbilia javanica TaxID=47235 RepID=A0AAN8MS08_9PEZI
MLDTASIRSSNEHGVAQYLRQLAGEGDVENTTQQLIDAVERSSIPPSTLKIWLSISHTPAVLKRALEQDISVRIRKIAIEQFEKLLRSRKWKETWDSLGAVEGLTGLLRSLSASDVQDACRAIGSSTKGADLEKREAITDLFLALKTQTSDTRPLANCYQYLLPACTKDRVARVVNSDLPEGNHRQQDLLLRNHSDILRGNFVEMVLDYEGLNSPWLFALMREYPAVPGAKPNLSSSMEFSLEVLRKLVHSGQVSQISDEAFVYEISDPLLTRCVKKHTDTEILKEAVALIVQYIKLHPSVANTIWNFQPDYYNTSRKPKKDKVFEKIAGWWLQMPETFEELFQLLLVRVNPGPSGQKVNIRVFDPLIKNFTSKHRYGLLKFCIQSSVLREDEPEITFDEALVRTVGFLDSELLPALNAEETLDLFLRLRKARGDGIAGTHYVGAHCNFFTLGKENDIEGDQYLPIDLDLWQVHFLQKASRQEEAEELAKLRIEERKKAHSTPDGQLRSLHSRGVLLYAAASGSLSLLGDVVNWTRRLTRDPHVAPYLNEPPEMHKLLTGLLLPIGTDASVLRKGVEHANQIISTIIDIICSGSKDPAFTASNWRGVFRIPHFVISERINRSALLKEHFSDEDVYSILWEDTLRMILDLEQKVIDDKQLQNSGCAWGVCHIAGRVGQPLRVDSRKAHVSAYRFLDNLAKERNELWRKRRISKCPEVANLPEPYPQGLPIQYLIGAFDLDLAPLLDDVAPYIASRVKSAVFPTPDQSRELVSARVDLLRDPLGLFFEDYRYALELYLTRAAPEKERKDRLDSAWAYAVGPLSEGRLDTQQAIRYWRGCFNRALYPKVKKVFLPVYSEKQEKIPEADLEWLKNLSPEPEPEPLKIPSQDDSASIQEWDASPEYKEDIEVYELGELTYIDVSINPRTQSVLGRISGSCNEDEPIELPVPKTTGKIFWYNTTWTRAGNNKVKSAFQQQEAQILSALLYLQTKTQSPEQLLASPFPSTDDVRYPSISLSTGCLSILSTVETGVQEAVAPSRKRRRRGYVKIFPKTSKDLSPNTKAAFKALEAQISFVPPVLVLKLVENAFSSLDSTDPDDPDGGYPALESLAFNLLRLLARSDRPKLALQLAIKVISKYPAAPFWFKSVITLGFFRDLTPKDASEGMSTFAETVFKLLSQMGEPKASKDSKPVEEKPSTDTTSGDDIKDPVEQKPSTEATSWDDIQTPSQQYLSTNATSWDAVTDPVGQVVSANATSWDQNDWAGASWDATPDPPAEEAKPKPADVDNEPSFVKVSTIKLLIELFEDADFIPKSSSLSNIHTLCKSTSNIDVHKTVVYYLIRGLRSPRPLEAEFFSIISTLVEKNSDVDLYKLILDLFNLALKLSKLDNENQSLLLSMVVKISKGNLNVKLQNSLVEYLLRVLESSAPKGYDQILAVLRDLVSSCGNINESEPVTEDQWKVFEETTELPDYDLQRTTDYKNNPILLRLLEFYNEILETPSLNIAFTERIMIPIIQELNFQTSRYFSIFLQQNGITKAEQESFKLPPASKTIGILETVIENGIGPGIIPLIHDYVSTAIFNINPPEILEPLNKKCKDDKKFSELCSSKNWSQSYNQGTAISDEINLISSIQERIELLEDEDINASIREQFLKIYETTLWKESKDLKFSYSDHLLKTLEPKPLDTVWLKYIQPILKDTLHFITSLRTPEWEQNPNRHPQILPETFTPNLWLLNFPSPQRNDQDQEIRCRVFVDEVIGLVNTICGSYDFMSKACDLNETLGLTQNDAEDDLVVASYLGDLTDVKAPITPQAHLRIELASMILPRRKFTENKTLKERVDNMIESWKTCWVESIRRLGYSTIAPQLTTSTKTPKEDEETSRQPKNIQRRSRRRKQTERASRWGPPDLTTIENTKKPAHQRPNRESDLDWFVPGGW